MRCYRLSIDQKIKLPVDKVFDFFSQPENLEKITPSEIGFQIITPTPIEMKKNLIIDYKIKICGFPVSWKTCIINYKPPIFFSDIQIKGPYSMWEHTHIFKECESGTKISDIVYYKPPLGLIGVIVNYFFISKMLKKIFNYRYKTIGKIFNQIYPGSFNEKIKSNLIIE
tara:strand:- start:179 stop:685 length:507 start_codon:yes stop_codon:yes gene_type:complete